MFNNNSYILTKVKNSILEKRGGKIWRENDNSVNNPSQSSGQSSRRNDSKNKGMLPSGFRTHGYKSPSIIKWYRLKSLSKCCSENVVLTQIPKIFVGVK